MEKAGPRIGIEGRDLKNSGLGLEMSFGFVLYQNNTLDSERKLESTDRDEKRKPMRGSNLRP
jgi:hypothetical protein